MKRKTRSTRPSPTGPALASIQESVRKTSLVAVMGTGVSLALTNGKHLQLSWRGLIENGFEYAARKGLIGASQVKAWKPQLASSDIDDLLGSAEFVSRKLGAPEGDIYATWLREAFERITPASAAMQDALRAIHSAGIPVATLNYDTLLEQVLGLPGITLGATPRVMQWARGEFAGVLHLHGSWEEPAGCVLGIRDYSAIVGNEVRDLLQRSLSSLRRLLFIGCGDTFRDPNFTALTRWLRQNVKAAAPQHYALVTEGELGARQADTALHGFAEPVSYGKSHADLPAFLAEYVAVKATSRSSRKPQSPALADAKHAKVLRDYSAFLIRDCGQMTIEGVRADMNTAQRRFDLERLFVPLKLAPAGQYEVVDEGDAETVPVKDFNPFEEMFLEEALPVGKVLKKHRRIALLALPGGGKSLLLKRLAVAYSDPARRSGASDELPDLGLYPVLIRCRDWRSHIQLPIPTLLRKFSETTGQAGLEGFGDALVPLLKRGSVLLLVDGLDEIHVDADRDTFVENLERFLEQYKRVRLVVTSREAGFSLVAPKLARFCERLRIAPLGDEAIWELCRRWHLLMNAEGPALQEETRQVAHLLTTNLSLRSLAQNPLLLTMLLVVKHGAGRLPADRVSLYERAVEVLLDTWNIKGHAPLNLKEAIPQLSCLALKLMQAGKQTATESELLALLEEARENVPRIRHYAKDTPDEFLHRVELRSSLLVEAGLQYERGRVVPFYQFRHLTFQEYLAAVAVVEGHYPGYTKEDTLLTVLEPVLLEESWKEVIPMAAALAGKRAEPVMAALVKLDERSSDEPWYGFHESTPAGRLLSCLAEEVEAQPETLSAALRASIRHRAKVDMFGHALLPIVHGPYGKELERQFWLVFAELKDLSVGSLFGTTLAMSDPGWRVTADDTKLKQLLNSDDSETLVRGLLRLNNLLQHYHASGNLSLKVRGEEVHRCLFHADPVVWTAACLVCASYGHSAEAALLRSPEVLNRLLELSWQDRKDVAPVSAVAALVALLTGAPRGVWPPQIPDVRKQEILRRIAHAKDDDSINDRRLRFLLVFHAKLMSNAALAAALGQWRHPVADEDSWKRHMLSKLGKAGRPYMKRRSAEQTSMFTEKTGTKG